MTRIRTFGTLFLASVLSDSVSQASPGPVLRKRVPGEPTESGNIQESLNTNLQLPRSQSKSDPYDRSLEYNPEVDLFWNKYTLLTVVSMPPAQVPTMSPTPRPSGIPTTYPVTIAPTASPSVPPSVSPSVSPSALPSLLPSNAPTVLTLAPVAPSSAPSSGPSMTPSLVPGPPDDTDSPTVEPSALPTKSPVVITTAPVTRPTVGPTASPVASASPTPGGTRFSSVLSLQQQVGVCGTTDTNGVGCAQTNDSGSGGNPNDLLNCYNINNVPGGSTPFVVTDVRFWLGASLTPPSDLSIRLWNAVNGVPTDPILSQPLTGYVQGVNNIILAENVTIPTAEFCIGLNSQNVSEGLRIQNEVGNGTESFVRAPQCGATVLTSLEEFGLPVRFCIEAFVSGP